MTTAPELVLHHLVIKGLADADALGRCSGLARDEVDAALATLLAEDLVVERTGRLSGFSPTASGREADKVALAQDSLRLRRDELAAWYGRFEEVNAQFKELCVAWQIVDGPGEPVPNDHTDAAYDAAIVERLAAVHETTDALLGEVGDARLDRYGDRLAEAEAAVRSGDVRRFTAPLNDSYHDIWMELHHDLLASFDRERTAADA